MIGTRAAGALAAAILGVSIAFAPAHAQNPEVAALMARATEAEQRASVGHPASIREAARLHLEVAEAVGPDHPAAVSSLRAAARHLSFTRPQQAVDLMNRAADRALAQGDLVTAAYSYLDAAELILQGGRKLSEAEYGKVQAFVGHAKRLAVLPGFDREDREFILWRAGDETAPVPGALPRHLP